MSGRQGLFLLAAVLLALLAGMFLGGLRRSAAQGKHLEERKKKLDHSKLITEDIRPLLWIVTVGGLALAAYCIHENYTGGLPWVATMVGLPWTAHGAVCAVYLNMAKSDHKVGGITFEAAKAANFKTNTQPAGSNDSPAI